MNHLPPLPTLGELDPSSTPFPLPPPQFSFVSNPQPRVTPHPTPIRSTVPTRPIPARSAAARPPASRPLPPPPARVPPARAPPAQPTRLPQPPRPFGRGVTSPLLYGVQPVLTQQQREQQQMPPENLGSWLEQEFQIQSCPVPVPSPKQNLSLGRVFPTRPTGRVSPGKQEIRSVPTPVRPQQQTTGLLRSPQELAYMSRKYPAKQFPSTQLTTPVVKLPEAKTRWWGTMEAPEEVLRPWYQSQPRSVYGPRPVIPHTQIRQPQFRISPQFRPLSQPRSQLSPSPQTLYNPRFTHPPRPSAQWRPPAGPRKPSLINLTEVEIVEMPENDLLLLLENIGKQGRAEIFNSFPELREKYRIYFDD